MPKSTLHTTDDLHQQIKLKCLKEKTTLQAIVVSLLEAWVKEEQVTPPNPEQVKKTKAGNIPIDLEPDEPVTTSTTDMSWANVEYSGPRYAADEMTDEELGYGKGSGGKSALDILNTAREIP